MKYELCIACDHCDPSKTNARQQVRCTKIASYVDRFNGCDYFENKALDEHFKNIVRDELTDNELIKALECCLGGSGCIICPLKDSPTWCISKAMKGAFSLINRQQAEIERLKTNCLSMAQTIPNMAKAERAEAIKEFAERLHCHCQGLINEEWNKKVFPTSWADAYEEFDEDVDNLMQEMVGDPQ